MSAEQTIYSTFYGESPPTAVEEIVSDRIYPIIVPENKTLPAIAYQRVNTEYVNTIHATALASKGTFDIFCVAAEFDQADDLADAVVSVVNASLVMVVLNRTHSFDETAGNYAVVVTVDVDE